jgi:protein ImuA
VPAQSLQRLRQSLATLEAAENGFAAKSEPITFGMADLDRALGGGLPRGTMHEIHAARGADAAAEGFALALMLRAAKPAQPLVWVRQDIVAHELGELHAPGFAELGADPDSVIAVRVRDALSAIRAGNEALRCRGLGAVAIEIWGAPKALDLTATRRLTRAAQTAGTTAFLIRIAAAPAPSAAWSRWHVRTLSSVPLAANAPGLPTFAIDLERHRAGCPPRSFCVEWDRDKHAFRKSALSGPVVSAAADRPAASAEAFLRRRAG